MFIKLVTTVVISSLLCNPVFSYPSHWSLAGLPRDELNKILPGLQFHPPPFPVGPLNDTGAKLVNDQAHPWKPLRPGDIRGPCPGLNTLASHGWLPCNGIATPQQIVLAVQEAYNMQFDTALLITYAAFLVDGNVVNNLLSIGSTCSKSAKTGADPPQPATVGGLNTHAVFEGDASLMRGDFFFGNNHDFNETLFQELVQVSNEFGAGKYNLTVAGEIHHRRIQDSIATNPTFSFVAPRYLTAFGETTFPVNFFIDGRHEDGQLDLDVARGFFQNMRMPDDFFRPSFPRGTDGVDVVLNAHPIKPGRNVGGVNNYVVDPTSADFMNFCLLYTKFVNQTIKGLYPNPTGVLRQALNFNLNVLFQAFIGFECTQLFPYGKD